MGLPLEEVRAEQFLRLYADNRHRLGGFVHALVPNWQDAEDLMQEALLIIWRKFDEFDSSTEFFPWAARVAQFEILNFRRLKARRGPQLNLDVINEVAATMIATTTDMELQREALASCVAQLSDRERRIVNLRYDEGGSVHSVAESLGRSASLVHKLLNRIRLRLLLCIRRRVQA